MTSWTDYQDDISDAISDSMDVDWSASVGAQAVVAWLNENKPLSAANPATVLAILAEISALNDYGRSVAKEALGYRDRATEAERKLAEAEEENGDMKDRLSFASQPLRDYVVLTGEGHDVSVLNSETRTFLSKEAERG